MMTPLAARQRYSAGVNIAWDGNSLVAGVGSSGSSKYVSTQTGDLAPLAGSNVNIQRFGIAGQTWRQMNGLDGRSAADIDAAWVAGKKNVLILWETTNSIYNTPMSGAQAASDAKDYVTARLAANPWSVVILTTLPRQDPSLNQTTTNNYNAELLAADAIIKRDYRSWGAKAVVDLRASIPQFNQPDYTPASFAAYPTLWADNPHIHLTDAGYALVAQATADRLRQLQL